MISECTGRGLQTRVEALFPERPLPRLARLAMLSGAVIAVIGTVPVSAASSYERTHSRAYHHAGCHHCVYHRDGTYHRYHRHRRDWHRHCLLRPDSLAMNCEALQAMVARHGAVVIGTGPHLYDRYVYSGAFCAITQETKVSFIRAADTPSCFVGYTCLERSSVAR